MGAVPGSCGQPCGGAGFANGAVDRFDAAGFALCCQHSCDTHHGLGPPKEATQISNVMRPCPVALCAEHDDDIEWRTSHLGEPQILLSETMGGLHYDRATPSSVIPSILVPSAAPSDAPSPAPLPRVASSTPIRQAASTTPCRGPAAERLLPPMPTTANVVTGALTDASAARLPATPYRNKIGGRPAWASTASPIRAGPSPYRGGILSTFTPSPHRIADLGPRRVGGLVAMENDEDWELQQAIIASLDDQLVRFSHATPSPMAMVYGNGVRELADGYPGSTISIRHPVPESRSHSSDDGTLGHAMPDTAPIMPNWIMQSA